jgi:hypothetical protein
MQAMTPRASRSTSVVPQSPDSHADLAQRQHADVERSCAEANHSAMRGCGDFLCTDSALVSTR